MSQIADITVYDGAATPVAHVLKAISVTKENGTILAVWQEKLASLPDEAQVKLTLDSRVMGSGVHKNAWSLTFPVMEAVAGQNAAGYTAAPKVAYVDRNDWVSFAHPRSTVTSRRTARQGLTNLSNNVATSVAAAVTGVYSEAIDSLIAPT